MAVTPAERRSYDDRIRQTREEAENKETDLVKRQSEEMKRLEKRHQEEIRKITEEYQKSLENVQGSSRESMTERDMKHRNEMNEVRNLYVEQLRKKMEDSALQRRQLQESYASDLEKQKRTTASQHGDLSSKQNEELAKRDALYQETMKNARDGMKAGIDENRQKLTSAHEREREVLRRDRDESIMRKENEINELSKTYRGELRNERRAREKSENDWSARYVDTVESMKSQDNDRMDSQRKLMANEVDHQRNKFEQRWSEKNDQIEAINENFRDSVGDRQNTQVRSRDSQIRALKDKLNNNVVNDGRQRSAERRNLTEAYEKRWSDLERQKNETREVMKDLGDKRLDSVTQKNNEVMNSLNRNYRSEMSMQAAKNRDDRRAMSEVASTQIDQTIKSADKRVENMKKLTTENVRNLTNVYGESVEELRTNFSSKLDLQRERQMEEQGKNTSVMTNRFRELEKRYEARYDQTVQGYEEKIKSLQENQAKEKKRLEQTYEQRLSDLKKGHRVEKDGIEQRYESKLAVTDERHQEELERVKSRQNEELRTAASRIANYSKKA